MCFSVDQNGWTRCVSVTDNDTPSDQDFLATTNAEGNGMMTDIMIL